MPGSPDGGRAGGVADAASAGGGRGIFGGRLGVLDCGVLELADRPGRAAERTAPAAPIGGDETEQEDDRLAGDQEQDDHREQERRHSPRRAIARRR